MIRKDLKLSIALTDDNIHDHIFIKSSLAEFKKIEVTSFYAGEELIEFLLQPSKTRKANPDLIMLDLNMPGLSGLEVFEILRSHSVIEPFRIIILSTCIELDLLKCSKNNLKAYNKPEAFSEYSKLIPRIIKDFLSDLPIRQLVNNQY